MTKKLGIFWPQTQTSRGSISAQSNEFNKGTTRKAAELRLAFGIHKRSFNH
ncbi:hypothetical protein ACU6U9_19020 [Pseudomonas sp. HK3]